MAFWVLKQLGSLDQQEPFTLKYYAIDSAREIIL